MFVLVYTPSTFLIQISYTQFYVRHVDESLQFVIVSTTFNNYGTIFEISKCAFCLKIMNIPLVYSIDMSLK